MQHRKPNMGTETTRYRCAWDEQIEAGIPVIVEYMNALYERELAGLMYPRVALQWGDDKNSVPLILQACTQRLRLDVGTIADADWERWFSDYKLVKAHKLVTILTPEQGMLRELSGQLAGRFPAATRYWVQRSTGDPNIQIIAYCALRYGATVAERYLSTVDR